ncbi:unnamed protein product [Leuciscus chuanchicus]
MLARFYKLQLHFLLGNISGVWRNWSQRLDSSAACERQGGSARRQWVQGTGGENTVDIDGALGRGVSEKRVQSGGQHYTLSAANMGLVQSRGRIEIYEEVLGDGGGVSLSFLRFSLNPSHKLQDVCTLQ